MSTDTHCNDLDTLLPRGREPRRRTDARVALLGQRRRARGADDGALDRFLLESYGELASRNAQLGEQLTQIRALQEKLRAKLDQITAPPWFPCVFLRSAETPAGALAEVYHAGTRRLVHVGDDVDGDALEPGQVVYLGHELNAVLGVAPPGAPQPGETATVERVLSDGRLVIRDRDVEVLVHAAPALAHAGLTTGDAVRWSRELMLVLEPVEPSAPREVFVTEHLSGEPPQRLGGLERETEQLVALFTQSLARPDLASRYDLGHGNTLLLHGPPGNGKTSLARIIGSALAAATGQQCRFASVKGAQLEDPYVGVSSRNVRQLFAELRRGDLPALLFIDEVEAIGRTRGGLSGHHSDRLQSTWLTEIDGLERGRPIAIVAATNRKDMLDQALLERLSASELFIGRPSLSAAREIFAIHLPQNVPFGPNAAEAGRTREAVVDIAVSTLYCPNADNAVAELRLRDGSARTVRAREILSGRAIEQICLDARRRAFTRDARDGAPGVRVEDIQAAVANALERLSTTLSPANARALLTDLPQDLDVVAVEPVRRKVARHRYLHDAATV